ncbi:lipoprotein [Spiroplasma endosymbiont of Diplazon laetatorius]|uniref:lipoprotein n=1 Tax=Spiroplasma endosymbiont of Diplazon laetatorius TaxID=3066322 RepID=UPI0030CCD0AE
MKKLLGMLGAVSLTVASPSLVVACGTNQRITSPKLNKDLAKQLLVSISGNKDLANIDFGSMFTDAEIESVIVNMVNELLSLQYSFDSTNAMYEKLGFKNKYTSNTETGIEDAFKQRYSLESRTVAENKLFEEYTKSIKGDRLDYWSVQNNYSLNIKKDTTVKSFDGKEDIKVSKKYSSIYFGGTGASNIWRFTNELANNKNANLPEITDLTKEYSGEKKANFYVQVGENDFKEISSKTALYLRFQDYFNSKLLEDINENLLTSAYLKTNMFDIKKSKDENKGDSPYINPSSAIFNKTQTLNDKDAWKTNVKMVWTMRFDNTDPKVEVAVSDAIRELNTKIDSATGAFKFDDNGKGNTVSDVMDSITQKVSGKATIVNDTKAGYDSYFGLKGYQGLTIYNGDTSLGDSPISGKAYEANIKAWNKGAGIVKSDRGFLTKDAEDSNYADLVFVLPIYMIELLGGSDTTSTYKVKGKTVEGKEPETKEMIFSNTTGDDNIYIDRWNSIKNKELHTEDVKTLAKKPTSQEALLNEIMYAVSKDTSSSDLAKTVIYSKYLDKDEVYYAGLWDKIGTYIKSEDDKDD